MIHSRLRLVLSAAHRPDGYGIRTEDVKSPPTRRSNRHTPPVSGPVGWLMHDPSRQPTPAVPRRTPQARHRAEEAAAGGPGCFGR